MKRPAASVICRGRGPPSGPPNTCTSAPAIGRFVAASVTTPLIVPLPVAGGRGGCIVTTAGGPLPRPPLDCGVGVVCGVSAVGSAISAADTRTNKKPPNSRVTREFGGWFSIVVPERPDALLKQ